MRSYLIPFFAVCMLTLGVMAISSCEKKITGCTNADAENYDPDANVSGNCVYARDKFIGTYKGALDCTIETLDNNDLTFSIEEKAGSNDGVRLLITLSGVPTLLDGTVEGNKITVSANLKNVPYNFGGITINVDVDAAGNATTSDSGMTLNGNITVATTTAGSPLFSDNCMLTGVKQ